MSKHFPFLTDDDEAKLKKLFHNHLSLAQFQVCACTRKRIFQARIFPFSRAQLARGTVEVMSHSQRALAEETLRLVLANGPSKTWLSSPSVPTAAHLLWLLEQFYTELDKVTHAHVWRTRSCAHCRRA
jgi:hypothetical protein